MYLQASLRPKAATLPSQQRGPAFQPIQSLIPEPSSPGRGPIVEEAVELAAGDAAAVVQPCSSSGRAERRRPRKAERSR